MLWMIAYIVALGLLALVLVLTLVLFKTEQQAWNTERQEWHQREMSWNAERANLIAEMRHHQREHSKIAVQLASERNAHGRATRELRQRGGNLGGSRPWKDIR